MFGRRAEVGMSMLDTIVGIALMTIVFLGFFGAFRLAVDVTSNNKARAGAIALANERMEYVRSLSYSLVGTSGGIPSGAIAQSETVSLNNIPYTRRTFVVYEDDPKDGSGVSDTNGVPEDYKSVKVDIAWTSRTGERHITLVTRVSPVTGLESAVPGGTLAISAINAAGQAISGASVRIVNASTTPAIDVLTFTDALGFAVFLGAPAGAGYQVTVSKTGFSTAQTYSATAQNTNPNPGNLTVSEDQTTAATFAIDLLGSKTIRTWTQVLTGAWPDLFADSTNVATSTNVDISGDVAQLASVAAPGELQSVTISPALLARWRTLTIVDDKPLDTSILYAVYDGSGSARIPDSQVPGNSAGLAGGTIDLSGISTSTYPSIRIGAVLSGSSTSPTIDSWNVSYDYGPQPLPNISFTLTGAKSIGSGPSGALYKFSTTSSSGVIGSVTLSNVEYDNHTITIAPATGYDIASACAPQPESLAPAASLTTDLQFVTHTADSLLVDVRSSATGALIPDATVHLSLGAYAATSTSNYCGQSFFSGLSAASNYSISVTATGYQAYTSDTVNVSGTSRLSVPLN